MCLLVVDGVAFFWSLLLYYVFLFLFHINISLKQSILIGVKKVSMSTTLQTCRPFD